MEHVPDGAVPLTSDRLLYKIVNEEGDKYNRSASFNDTVVAVEYIIKAEDGFIIDSSQPGNPLIWITGDKDAESELYIFFPKAIGTMREKEVATYFMDRTYLLGDAPLVTEDGRRENSRYFTAIVHLLKSTPLDKINIGQETNSNNVEPKTETENKKETKSPTEQANKSKKDNKEEISLMQARFALFELKLANEILSVGKPAAARKEFNRSKLAWNKNVDLSKTPPDFTDDNINLPEADLKKYVNSRSSFGVARTFLVINPPLKDKAIVALQAAIDADSDYTEAIEMLKSLGVDFELSFPPLDDPRLHQATFWQKENIPIEKRFEYTKYVRENANKLFHDGLYDEALNEYNRGTIALPSIKKVSDEHKQQWYELSISTRLNALACYYELGKYRKLLEAAGLLLDHIKKSELNFNMFMAKCLYRKALAYIKLHMFEEEEDVIKQLKQIEETNSLIRELTKLEETERKLKKREEEFVYQKMTGTLK
ncbi:peptidyl-prolyl cis-trans isomerase PASTICCINO1 [Histomonas meleagridis]|uniref:peptidyl-prolyl cis-trans isomerase PASTICCINO1 n=1 Tax=Histomonas meleagridis TaxID=135588 RepID=UPI00355A70B0|nr:peptidyl-prolyl cis-trans isomerase PASTICCINO1 [Histomonas meleagridis]KAH0804856.1 peptidyl-prolyl cis-trans isomerase PASTICCINO1 [Histomonas meleagridis]